MNFKNKKIFSLVLSLMLLVGIFIVPVNNAYASKDTVNITILGTSDVHGNVINWSYEDGKEIEETSLAKIYSLVEKVRKENPNTLLLDNGDTVQGTILTDDLYNVKLEEKHPVIDVMNFMGYDSMTLGNHEFNFGLDLVDKIVKEAEFPILSANIYNKKDNSYFVKPYIIKEVGGVKIGILGLTTPNVPKWDGVKVTDLNFEAMDKAAAKAIKELKEKEKVDIIIATAHAGVNGEYDELGGDSVKKVIENNPEIEAFLVGHDHSTVKETIGNTVVGGPRNEGRQVVRFDLALEKENNKWEVKDRKVDVIDVKEFEASKELVAYANKYHDTTLKFLEEVIGEVTEDFHPVSEVKGIPEAQVRDTAVMDLINEVQLKNSGADVSAAALFKDSSNLKKGAVNFASVFDIYKFPNTLKVVEVNGKELKDYMEWSAAYYNTYKPGDVTISFNPEIRGYKYDMFAGVDYKIDISKPAGERIVDLKFKGEPVKETDKFKLAINDYRYSGLKTEGIISGEPIYDSDPISLRSMIVEHIRNLKTLEPKTDNNWEIIGADLDHPLRDYIIKQVNEGKIQIPTSEDGRTSNVKALNVNEMIDAGLIPEEVLKEHNIKIEKPVEEQVTTEPAVEVKKEVTTEPAVKKYSVKTGDVLWRIAKKFNTTWQRLAELNNLKNPHLIFPNQEILVP